MNVARWAERLLLGSLSGVALFGVVAHVLLAMQQD